MRLSSFQFHSLGLDVLALQGAWRCREELTRSCEKLIKTRWVLFKAQHKICVKNMVRKLRYNFTIALLNVRFSACAPSLCAAPYRVQCHVQGSVASPRCVEHFVSYCSQLLKNRQLRMMRICSK